MRLLGSLRNKILLIAVASPWLGFAQDAAKAAAPAPADAAPATAGYSYLMIAVASILLIAIIALSQVFLRLTMYVYENKKKTIQTVALFIMMVLCESIMAQGDAATGAAPIAAKASEPSLPLEFWAGFMVILAEMVVVFILLIRIWAMLEEIYPKKQADASMGWHMPRWFDRFNKSVAVEKEQDIMLDHDYDGIRELDNALPPWWVYMFYATVIWGVCYFTYFHILSAAPLSAGEYANEMEAAKIAKEAYMRTAKNNVDENTIVFDKSYLDEGKKIYTENCVACHGDAGQGGVGPNLTDDYWIHGGKINDVFKTVKYGWPANGMKSWQSDLGAMQIAQVVCYVKSLKGTNPPNPKAPQGEVYKEDGAPAAAGAAKVDSTGGATANAAAKDSTSK